MDVIQQQTKAVRMSRDTAVAEKMWRRASHTETQHVSKISECSAEHFEFSSQSQQKNTGEKNHRDL